MENARAAYNQEELDKAIMLYEKAEEYHREVVSMEGSCHPANVRYSMENIVFCQERVEDIKRYKKNKVNYEKDLEIFEIYNKAKAIYIEGNAYARNQQWKLAVSSFEEAETIFTSIASPETENGRKAIKAAKDAKKLANLAQQHIE